MIKYKQAITENYKDMTKGLKKVADFLLEDPAAFAARSAYKVGEVIGVSETMVIRFCHAIGYKGFNELKTEVQEAIYNLNQIHLNYETENDKKEQPLYRQTMRRDQMNCENAAKDIQPEDMAKVVKKLNGADYCLVAGQYASYSMAHWFSFTLNLIKGGTRLFRMDSDLYMENLTKESVLVVFSFYRYSLEPLWLAEEAAKRGIYVLAFTDSPLAPVIEYADHAFIVNLPTRSILQEAPVIFSILNAVLTGVSQERGENGCDQKKHLLETRHLNRFFVPH